MSDVKPGVAPGSERAMVVVIGGTTPVLAVIAGVVVGDVAVVMVGALNVGAEVESLEGGAVVGSALSGHGSAW
jgi:hypothetical protein